MSNNFRVDISDAMEAFKKAPDQMVQYVQPQIHRAAEELAREEKREAPKAFSTLANSIRARMTGQLSAQVAPGVDYASMVNAGTGPGGTPNDLTLLDWIRVKGIKPRNPYYDVNDLVFLIGRAIRERGTPQTRFVEVSADRMTSRIYQLIRQGVTRGVQAVGS